MPTIRQATIADVAALERVRGMVRENRLSTPIPRERLVAALADRGRGWVADDGGEIVGFTFADDLDASIWALFLLPEWEGKGLGRVLLDHAVTWLHGRGHQMIWLSTEPGTRAEGFYAHLGWRRVGVTPPGETRFEFHFAA